MSSHRGFARQPALDGVRAVAVVLVLLFHQGWLSGGYVGVSVFFTLSGYLITSLALVEHDRTGGVDVPAFYGRRIRRLLPASIACIVGVVALAFTGVFADVEHLRRDLWGALGQVYNWVALGGDRSYAQLVGTGDLARSPLEHYWSLAIEEQFYWLWPLALLVILRRPARGRLVVIGTATVVFAVAAPVIAMVWGPDAAYWATPARLAEILVGALLAVVLRTRPALPPVAGLLAPAGLAVIVWAAVAWPSASGPAYDGWLPLFAVASAALIAGLQVSSRLRAVLGSRPLVVIGAISYGIYLFHWPVYVVLDEERTNLPSLPLFVLRVAVTLALATLSFRHLETPVRRARPRRLLVPAGGVGTCLAAAGAVLFVPGPSQPYWMTASAAEVPAAEASIDTTPLVVEPAPTDVTVAATTPATGPAQAPTPTTSPPPPSASAAPTTVVAAPTVPVTPPLPTTAPARPVRVLVVGDSTAMATAKGLERFDDDHADLVDVVSMASPGCGFIADGHQRQDVDDTFAAQCEGIRDDVAGDLSWLRPDVVMGMVTITDLDERTWDDAEGPLGPADPRFFERLVSAYETATAGFLAAGATDVLWVVPPIPKVAYGPEDQYVLDPARAARYADALRQVAAAHPGQVGVVDLAAWVAAQPEPPTRPDGLHWSVDAATFIADAFLGPVLVDAALT